MKNYKISAANCQESLTYTWLEKWSRRKDMSLLIANAYENSRELSLQKKAFKVKECARFLQFKACPIVVEKRQ